MIREALNHFLGNLPTVKEKQEQNGGPQRSTKFMCGRTFVITSYGQKLTEKDIQTIKDIFERYFYEKDWDLNKKGRKIGEETRKVLSNQHNECCGITFHPQDDWSRLEYDVVFS